MRSYRSVTVFLVLCLLLSCLSVAAWAQQIPEIRSGDTVTFSTTKDNHVVYYSFTPQTNGTYVLYDAGENELQEWLSVHTCQPSDAAFEQSAVAKGLDQVAFQAEAGVTYWLKLDCSWTGGGELTNSFALAPASAAQGVEVGYARLGSQLVGSEGELYLKYLPMGASSQITWSTSDTRVVAVEGDANGARFRLVGPGTAMIIATSAEGFTAQYEVTALDVLDIQLGGSLSITMHDVGGSYVTDEKYIRFTAAQSGSYALSVSCDETVDVWHGLEMSIADGNSYDRDSKSLRIDAEAGETYIVRVEFWGMYDQDLEHIFTLQPCVPPTGLQLMPESTMGYVGSSVTLTVDWEPDNSFGDALQWSVSDPAVAKIVSSDDRSAKLQLLAVGNVVVTASTEGGLSDTVQITVCKHPGTIQLVQGANPVLQLLSNDYFGCTFTAAATGYYRISADNKLVKIKMDAPTAIRDGERLYYLEEGKTYTGDIDNLSDEVIQSVITISLVEVPVPTAIKITKLPDQTAFLPGVLDDIWVYDLLEGMEMEVTWSDGQTSLWSFNEHDTSYEGYEIRWELRNTGSHTRELVMKLADVSTSCQLTIKNLNVVRMELLDASTLQIVENSCGYYDEYAKCWIYSDYLLGTRKIKITFDDGSSVVATPGQTVYGKRLFCDHNQFDQPWVKGGKNVVLYSYGRLTLQVDVEIIDSPVRRIQFITKPRTSFEIGDKRFFVDYGDGAYYFSPSNLEVFLKGLSFKIYYKDNTYKVVDPEDIQWIKVSGVRYPFVDGYPLGLMGELMMSYDPITGPCTSKGMIEYMGASLTYDIQLVEAPEEIPPTADHGLAVPATVLLMAVLTMAAFVTNKKKLF